MQAESAPPPSAPVRLNNCFTDWSTYMYFQQFHGWWCIPPTADLLHKALLNSWIYGFPKITFHLWFIVTNLFYWQIVRTLHSGTNNLCHNDKVPTNIQNVEMPFPANHQSHQNWIKQQIPQKTSIFPVCWNSIFICIFIYTIPAKKLSKTLQIQNRCF